MGASKSLQKRVWVLRSHLTTVFDFSGREPESPSLCCSCPIVDEQVSACTFLVLFGRENSLKRFCGYAIKKREVAWIFTLLPCGIRARIKGSLSIDMSQSKLCFDCFVLPHEEKMRTFHIIALHDWFLFRILFLKGLSSGVHDPLVSETRIAARHGEIRQDQGAVSGRAGFNHHRLRHRDWDIYSHQDGLLWQHQVWKWRPAGGKGPSEL